MRQGVIRYLLVTFLCCFSAENLKAEGILPLATGEWEPYISERLENHGVAGEIVVAVVHEMGMTPQYDFHPWERTEKVTKVGHVFAAFPYAKNDTRLESFDFSDPFLMTKTVFFYYKPNSANVSYSKLEDLQSFRIGGEGGHFYLPIFEAAGLDVYVVNHRKQMVQMLRKGRVDMVPMDVVGGWQAINEFYPDEVRSFAAMKRGIERDQEEAGSYLMVSRKYPNAKALTQRFNEALKRIKVSGVYDAIIKRHGIQN